MLTRRKLLTSAGMAAISAPLIACTLAEPAAATNAVATPQQTAGPFYPDEFPVDHDADLLQFMDMESLAQGEIVHMSGMVTDATGEPVGGATIDLWQCDANGIYHHPGDREEGRDTAFQGFGRTETDADGRYSFRTIRPVPYPGRTSHIHLRVWRDGTSVLTTQFYDADQSVLNMEDSLYRSMSADERALVTVPFIHSESEPGALMARLDVRLA